MKVPKRSKWPSEKTLLGGGGIMGYTRISRGLPVINGS